MRNKIIPFNKNFHKSASSNRYELKAQISVYISRNNDRYDIDWSSPLYYENGTTNIKYICNPSNIAKEKLAEYLWVSLNVYKLKEEGAL